MAIKDLKKFIFENDKIAFVLESIGCHHIQYHQGKNFYSCGNYNGDNVGAVNVKNNEYLNVVNWTRQKEFGDCSDIITLTQYNKQCSFIDAVKYLHDILGLEYKKYSKPKKSEEEKQDILDVFKRFRKPKRKVNVGEINFLNGKILDEYVSMLHIDWFRDGVMPWTRDKFDICYSYRRNRIIVPHHYWLTGELVGVNARTTLKNWEELGIPKYLLTTGYDKSQNVYGYWENHDDIERAGYCVLYEGEKSVLKRDSRNDPTGLALSGKSISEEQRAIILSLNIREIVIAFDKDVPMEEVYHACENFYRLRKVSYIYDKYDLIGKKDSPADASNKIFDYLFKYRTVYGEEQHKHYLKGLGK